MGNYFGNNLRKYRESLHISQSKFAEKINSTLRGYGKAFDYSNRSISKWENGDTMPSLDVVLAISEMTGIGLDELFKEDIAEFRKQSHQQSREKNFVRWDNEYEVPYYDLKYVFLTEAIKNIYQSDYTPYGVFYANTIIVQKTEFPTNPKEPLDKYAEAYRKSMKEMFDKDVTDKEVESSYNFLEKKYSDIIEKPLSYQSFASEIVPLSTLLRHEWLHGKVASILYNCGVQFYNGRLLKEGEPPFFDVPDEIKALELRQPYGKIFDDISEPGGLLLAAAKAQLFSSQNAQLKRLFKEECHNQLQARQNLFKVISDFKETNTTYFIYENSVYAKHSIRIEMPTSEYEDLYREYMSFIDEVPLKKEYSPYGE